MAKSKNVMVSVRITGPDCWDGDRLYLPGETALVQPALADEWIKSERAVIATAEVTNGDRQDNS